jgi:hypothetical protein
MSQDKINTTAIQQFINLVKSADLSHSREVKMDITTAKTLSYTLSLTMTRLVGDYEGLLQAKSQEDTIITVAMDGGSWEEQK